MNKVIRDLRNAIINLLNTSVLPLEVKRLILLEVLSQVQAESDKVILQEIENNNKGGTTNGNSDEERVES